MKPLLLVTFLFFSQLNFSQNEFMLAENYYRQGEYEKAAQLYNKLFEKSPYNTTYIKRLISCYQETSQFLTAETLIKKQLLKNPAQTYLNVELGYNYERQNKKDIAELFYKKAIASIDKNPSFGGIIGRFFKDHNLLQYAVNAYQKTMQKNPNSNYNFQVAQIYGEQGNFEKMFTAFLDLVDSNENYLQTVQRYTSRYLTDDKNNSSNQLFKKALLRKSISNPKNTWNQLLSWLFIQQKEYNKAFIQEKALFTRNPDFLSNINRLGKIAFDAKDFDTAKNCFDFIQQNTVYIDDKLNAITYKLKIAIATKQPNIESYFDEVFNQYGKATSTIQVQLLQANYYTFQKNNPEKAIAILTHALGVSKSKFQKARIKLKLGDVYVFTGKFNKALIYFSQVQTSIKNHYLAQEARFKVAQASYFKNDFKWAKAQLKVLKSSATQLIANDALDLYLIISGNEPKDSIKTGLQLYAMADILAYQNKTKSAIDSLQKITLQFKGQKIEDVALYKQATLFEKVKEYENAISNYLKIIQLNKEGIFVDDALYNLAELYSTQLNNQEKAKEYYQKIIFDHPSSIYLVDARKKYRKLRGDNLIN